MSGRIKGVPSFPQHRVSPAVTLEREPMDTRVAKLIEAAIASGKRSPKTVALYAGISQAVALRALQERGIR